MHRRQFAVQLGRDAQIGGHLHLQVYILGVKPFGQGLGLAHGIAPDQEIVTHAGNDHPCHRIGQDLGQELLLGARRVGLDLGVVQCLQDPLPPPSPGLGIGGLADQVLERNFVAPDEIRCALDERVPGEELRIHLAIVSAIPIFMGIPLCIRTARHQMEKSSISARVSPTVRSSIEAMNSSLFRYGRWTRMLAARFLPTEGRDAIAVERALVDLERMLHRRQAAEAVTAHHRVDELAQLDRDRRNRPTEDRSRSAGRRWSCPRASRCRPGAGRCPAGRPSPASAGRWSPGPSA